jgi:ribonuclease P protein component
MDSSRRLHKGGEFDTAYREGTVVNGPLLVVRHRPNGRKDVRWGFAVGKKLAKRAVDRNRVKRRLRAAASSLELVPGHDIVVTARGGAVEARYEALAQALEARLRRAGLLANGVAR